MVDEIYSQKLAEFRQRLEQLSDEALKGFAPADVASSHLGNALRVIERPFGRDVALQYLTEFCRDLGALSGKEAVN